MSNHAFLGSDGKEGRHVEETETLIVNRATLVVDTVVAVRIDFLDLCTFMEVVGLDNIVDLLITTPVNEVSEHQLDGGQVELTGATKTQDVMVIEVELFQVCNARRDYPLFEVGGDLILLRTGVAHEARVFSFFRCA